LVVIFNCRGMTKTNGKALIEKTQELSR